MPWVALDDQIFMNKKVARCDSNTKLLYIAGLVYCGNQLTDGVIPFDTLPLIAGMASIDLATAKQNASKLCSINLWDATADSWLVHDYLEYNPSREEVLHKKRVKSEAGRLGGLAKAGKKLASAKQVPQQNASKSLAPTPSPSPSDRDEGIARPPAGVPVYPQEPADPEYGIALSKLEALGMITGSAKMELDALWPDLSNGRREWVDDAVRVAQANDARAPIYAIRVLAGAVAANKRPGQAPEPKARKSGGAQHTSADLDEIFGVDIHGNPINH